MHVEHEIDPADRVVILKVNGVLGDRDLVGLADELDKIPGLPVDYALLIDLREAHGREVSSGGVHALASRPLVLPASCRRAVVVPSALGYGMARMYELLREEHGGAVRVFRDYDEARRWLTGSGP